ncbi:hypothetical protein KKE28_02340 [Patescibacteria group bacterium]|nr:hypothetical protein [Patescibacteria group bacterium]MBU1916433.1 hypothetical protein [Patescibacteria group bacterium]
MKFLRWLKRLIQISLQTRLTISLSTEEEERLIVCRPTAQLYLDNDTDATIIRLALFVYSQILRNNLPTLYILDPAKGYTPVCVIADKLPALTEEQVKRQLRLVVSHRTLKLINELGNLSEQNTEGVIRCALATLTRAIVGDTRFFTVRSSDGSYVQRQLLDLILYSVSCTSK